VYVHLLPDDLPDPAFFDELAGGNKGATRATETRRNERSAEVAATA
jgi:hypothetical protein